MKIEFNIRNERFAIELEGISDLPFRLINFMHFEGGNWKVVTGKQWTPQIQSKKGGQMGYIKFLLDGINQWLKDHFGENEPKTEVDKLMQIIKNSMVVENDQLVIK